MGDAAHHVSTTPFVPERLVAALLLQAARRADCHGYLALARIGVAFVNCRPLA